MTPTAMRNRQTGFFLLDWIVAYFDDGWLKIILKSLLWFSIIYSGIIVTPAYLEALRIHDAIVAVERTSGEKGNPELMTDLEREFSLRKVKQVAKEVVSISGRQGEKLFSVDYEKRVSALRGVMGELSVVFSFSFDQNAKKHEIISGKATG